MICVRLLCVMAMGVAHDAPTGRRCCQSSRPVAVSNAYGDTSGVHSRRIPVRVPTKDLTRALRQDVGYAVDLTIRGGRQRVAVIVRDELSMVSSTVTIDLEDGRGVDVRSVRGMDVEREQQTGS